jgi:hypothetical protein
MKYSLITKQICNYKSNNQFLDIYSFALIKSNSDIKTGISIITIETLKKLTGIPERTISSIISRLEKHPELLRIERKPIKERIEIGQYYFKKNYYYLQTNPENYFFIDDAFFKQNIPVKTKGFLLQLKSICKNSTNKYISKNPHKKGINKTELANLLNTDTKTLSKFLDECIELKQIKLIENGLLILNECFILNVADTRENEIYNTINNFCIQKGSVPPEINKTIISEIKARYFTSNKELESIADYSENTTQLLKQYSLLQTLQERCLILPEYPSLEYFLKVLDIKKVNSKKQENEITL